jgi:thymidylate kinase
VKIDETQRPLEPCVASPLRTFLSALFAQLDVDNVSYCIISNYERLPERVDGDVDLLVLPDHREVFRTSLLRVAASCNWLLVKDLSRFGFQSFWFKSASMDEYVQIDAWTIVHWRGIPLIDATDVIGGRTRYGSLPIPSPVAEAAILILKGVIHEGRIKERYRPKIVRAARTQGDELTSLLARPLRDERAAWLCDKIREETWAEVEGSTRRLRRVLQRRALCRNPIKSIGRWIRFFWGYLRAFLGRRNGMFLVLVGPDGSGKSTIASKVSDRLAPLFRCRYYYHGRFEVLPRLNSLKGLLSRIAGRHPSRATASHPPEESQPRPHSRARLGMYIAYYGVDYLLGHFVMRRHQSLGSLVVFDRYFYDWFIQSYTEKTPGVLLPLLKAIFPHPDLVVYLYNAPEVIHERKPELSITQIAQQEKKLRDVLKHIPGSVTIQTDMPAETIAGKIADRVALCMTHRRKRNGST